MSKPVSQVLPGVPGAAVPIRWVESSPAAPAPGIAHDDIGRALQKHLPAYGFEVESILRVRVSGKFGEREIDVQLEEGADAEDVALHVAAILER